MKLKQKLAIRYISSKLKLISVVSKKRAAEKAFDLFSSPVTRSRKQSALFDKVERLPMQVDDIPVMAYRWNKGAGKKVLVLHGFQSASKNFDHFIQLLINKGYEVMAIDAPAHGESGGDRILLPMYVKTIETAYDEFGPIESFVAHSFGGLAITHFLEKIEHSENYKVALIAPATETSSAIDLFFAMLNLKDSFRKEFEDIIVEKGGKHSSEYSIARAVKTIKAKILWIHDAEDDITPYSDVVPVINANHDHIKFITTKGLGHRKIYHDEKVVKAVIDFL